MYYDSVLNFNIKEVDIYNALNKYSSKNEVYIYIFY